MNSKIALVFCIGLIVGCGGYHKQAPSDGDATLQKQFLLDKEPTGAKEVMDVVKSAKDGDEVVVVGMIGGDGQGKPFVENRAAFRMIDRSKTPCEGDDCGNPWCELDDADLKESTLFVEFVDGKGAVVEKDAAKGFDVKMTQVVFVRGKLQREKDGDLTVVANGLHVKR